MELENLSYKIMCERTWKNNFLGKQGREWEGLKAVTEGVSI